MGTKVSDGQKVKKGNILVRQRGTTFAGGKGVKEGRDHTLYAVLDGAAKFGKKLGKKVLSVVASA